MRFYCHLTIKWDLKKGISCSHAIYSFRIVIDHYTINGSSVNVCTLDLSKAFDKLNHSALLVKLMNRNVPINLLMLLEYWFANSRSCVKWGSNSSQVELLFGKETPSHLVCMSMML